MDSVRSARLHIGEACCIELLCAAGLDRHRLDLRYQFRGRRDGESALFLSRDTGNQMVTGIRADMRRRSGLGHVATQSHEARVPYLAERVVLPF